MAILRRSTRSPRRWRRTTRRWRWGRCAAGWVGVVGREVCSPRVCGIVRVLVWERHGRFQGTARLTGHHPGSPVQRDDLRALAVVLLECIVSALALNGPSQLTNAESLQVEGGRGMRQVVAGPRFCQVGWLLVPRRLASSAHPVCLDPPVFLLQRLLGEVFVWGVDDFRCGPAWPQHSSLVSQAATVLMAAPASCCAVPRLQAILPGRA